MNFPGGSLLCLAGLHYACSSGGFVMYKAKKSRRWPSSTPGGALSRGRVRGNPLAAVLSLLAGLALLTPAAPALAAVLVSNMDKTTQSSIGIQTNHGAQEFTTGAYSYNMTSLELEFDRVTNTNPGYSVQIWKGLPGASGAANQGTLTKPTLEKIKDTGDPGTPDPNKVFTFTAPAGGITLDANTKYYVVIESSTNAATWISNTNSNDEDAGAGSGWSIANKSRYKAKEGNTLTSGTWLEYPNARKIRINGSISSNATLAASAITRKTATLTIGNWTAAWWYKGTQSGATCESVAANTATADLTGLTQDMSYIYKAYVASGCKAADELVSATFKTKAPGVEVSRTTLEVPEGGSVGYTVKLKAAPTHAVTITVGKSSGGDADLTADTDADTSGNQNTLTFTTTNWSTAQTVKVSAAEDTDSTDGTATFTHSASSTDSGYGASLGIDSVTATEGDNDSGVVQRSPLSPQANTIPSIWRSTLTVDAYSASGNSFFGCDDDDRNRDNCSTALTDNDFIYKGRTYTIKAVSISVTSTETQLLIVFSGGTALDSDIKDTGVLSLDTNSLAFSAAATTSVANQRYVRWTSPGFSWTDNQEVSLRIGIPASVEVSTSLLRVPEGGSAGYTVWLTKAPSHPVAITVAQVPGVMGIEEDADLTVDTDAGTAGNQNTLTFTTTNWSTPQTVRVYAAEDADSLGGRARLYHAPWSTDILYSDIAIAGVTVLELDNDGDAPGAITNLTAETVNRTYILKWTQPERATDIQYRRKRVEDDDDCSTALTNDAWFLYATPNNGRTWAAPGETSASLFRSYPAPGWTGTRTNPVLPDPGKLCYELRARNGNVPGDAASVIVYPETTASAVGVYMDHSSEFDSGNDLGKKTPHNNDSRRYVTEGGQVMVRVTLSKALSPAVAVDIPLWLSEYSHTGERRADSTDHNLPLRSSVTIPAGQRSAVKTIQTYCDEDTDNERFSVSLRTWDFPVSVVSGGGSSSTTVFINEPNPASTTCSGGGGGMSGPEETATATVALSVAPNPVTEGSPVTVTATLSKALAEAVSVPVTVTGVTSEGTTDHGTLSAIEIAAGETSGTGAIATHQDLDGDDETFTVALNTGTLPSPLTAGSPSSVTVTINGHRRGHNGEPVGGVPGCPHRSVGRGG